MGLVFTSEVGTPINRHNLTRQFKRLLAKAELPDERFHDLRHTCASLLIAQGADAHEVMETLGHSQITHTLGIYSHLFQERRRPVANRMDAALSDAFARNSSTGNDEPRRDVAKPQKK